MCRSSFVLSFMASLLALAAPARAAFQQQTCGTGYLDEIPVDIGSHEFDRDLWTYSQTGQINYGLNEWFSYPLAVNSNVAWLNPHLLNWNTEAGYDILTLNGGGSDYQFSGNLGTQWWGIKYGYNSGALYQIEWRSDYSNTEPGGAQWDYVRVQCTGATQTTTPPIRPLTANTRQDGIFIVDSNDVYYFSVTQPANRMMVLTLDVNAASDGPDGDPPDFDLYASTTTSMPDDSNYQWRAYDGNPTGTIEGAGEAIVLHSSTSAHTVYIGVHNFSGAGHFSLRANVVDNNRTLTICTQDQTPAQVMADPDWPNAKETIERILVRDFQATNGNMWMSDVRLKLQSSGLQTGSLPGTGYIDSNNYCYADPACDWCMTGYGRADQGMDGCGEQTDYGTGRVRIPNVHCQGATGDSYHLAGYDNPELLSKRVEHENGHGLGRMLTHSDVGLMLVDQYSVWPTEDSHTVMNGPFPNSATAPRLMLDTSLRYSTDFNHCLPLDPQQTMTPTCSQSTSDWTRIQTSGWTTGWTFPDQTKSSQPWLRAQANYWLRDQIFFTAE